MMQVDPMAASMPLYSPYHYSYNNPVSGNDPAGDVPRYDYSRNLYYDDLDGDNHYDEEEEEVLSWNQVLNYIMGMAAVSPSANVTGYNQNAVFQNGYGTWRLNNGKWTEQSTQSQIKARSRWYLTQDDRRGPIGGPVPWYGNFLGPGSDKNPYNLKGYDGKTLEPIDMLDQAAQRHDYAYFKAQTGGVMGALFNTEVAEADKQLAFRADLVILYSVFNLDDPVSGEPVSTEELRWAIAVSVAFSTLGTLKGLQR